MASAFCLNTSPGEGRGSRAATSFRLFYLYRCRCPNRRLVHPNNLPGPLDLCLQMLLFVLLFEQPELCCLELDSQPLGSGESICLTARFQDCWHRFLVPLPRLPRSVFASEVALLRAPAVQEAVCSKSCCSVGRSRAREPNRGQNRRSRDTVSSLRLSRHQPVSPMTWLM